MIVTIEKLVFGGQGLARHDGQVVFVWGALPGERVEIEVIKKRKGVIEAIATKILTASPDRITPRDNHYLSSAPWEILSWEKELYWKHEASRETMQKIGKIDITAFAPELVADDAAQYAYRNKIEFSITRDAEGKPTLAFFTRGEQSLEPITDSALAYPVINTAAKLVLEWIVAEKIEPDSIKSIIIRANQQGQAVAGIFSKEQKIPHALPPLVQGLKGVSLFYSDPRSPVSVPTQLLATIGDNIITEKILDTKLRYGINSFFQINPPLFEQALNDIAKLIPHNASLLDYYAGVGAISIPLADNVAECLIVESNKEAVEFAQKNINSNHLEGRYRAECLPAEQMCAAITKDTTLIVDPPRAGLHPDVIQAILHNQPEQIIYLSCELSTQARDINLLSAEYQITFIRWYNFFPRTPHVESLVELKRKKK